MGELWPQAVIHAFEPVPELFHKLRCQTSRNPNIKCHNVALADETKIITMHISSGMSDASSSILEPKEHLNFHPDVLFSKTIDVFCTTLDEWAAKNDVNHIDFLWLDMQGSEMLMLAASPQILSTVKAIYTEVNLIEHYSGCPLYKDFKQWLNDQGFYVEWEDLPWEDGGNALFVRN